MNLITFKIVQLFFGNNLAFRCLDILAVTI